MLRDIQASHGALRLSELHIDPAEAVATLAVRDGRAEALGPAVATAARGTPSPAPARHRRPHRRNESQLIADVLVPPSRPAVRSGDRHPFRRFALAATPACRALQREGQASSRTSRSFDVMITQIHRPTVVST